MPNVLIRDIPDADLDEIRAAAQSSGESMQARLLAAVQSEATYLRRQAALKSIRARLDGLSPVSEEDRAAVLDAIEAAHAERAAGLAGGDGASAPA